MTQCSQCLLELSSYPLLEGALCPNCGKPEPKTGAELHTQKKSNIDFSVFSNFFTTIWQVIRSPKKFFTSQGDFSQLSLSWTLSFFVLVQWIAAFFNFIWNTAFGSFTERNLTHLFSLYSRSMDISEPSLSINLDQLKDHAIEFLFGAGSVVLTPFTSLIKLFVIGFLIHVAVRLFINETQMRPHSYTTTLKILSYAYAPSVLCVLPGLGLILSWIFIFIACVAGIREVYLTSTSRALFAVLFPELLFVFFFISGMFVLIFMAFQFLQLVF